MFYLFFTGRFFSNQIAQCVRNICTQDCTGLSAAFFCTMAANTVERLYAVLITGSRVCFNPLSTFEVVTQCIASLYNDGVILVMLALQINCTRKRKLVFAQLIRYRAKSYFFNPDFIANCTPLLSFLYSLAIGFFTVAFTG